MYKKTKDRSPALVPFKLPPQDQWDDWGDNETDHGEDDDEWEQLIDKTNEGK